MNYMETLRNQIRKVMEDIEYNRQHNLDNTLNYELYTELSDEMDTLYNEC